ncbi:T9SS type A sorting domain-containing protein [bacterium]|nr:T9SS type A sorting domain-containing protein [bacterium]
MKQGKYIFISLFYLTFCGQLLAQPTVLVVRDCLPDGGDAVQSFLDLGATVTEIGTSELPGWNLTPYCVVYVTGIGCYPGDPVPVILSDAADQLETYVAAGGTLFYEIASYETFYLPGNVTTADWQDWENFIIPGHPIADGLPWMLASNCSPMSMSRFVDLPTDFLAIAESSYGGYFTTIAYTIGSGEVIATGTPGEYGIVGSQCWYNPDATGVLWMAIAQYCVETCGGSVTEIEAVPTAYHLERNYPNPFNPSTTLSFNLPEATTVKLAVYNLAGIQVRLIHSGLLYAGEHTFEFTPGNLASGNYVCSLESEFGVLTQKMLLLK